MTEAIVDFQAIKRAKARDIVAIDLVFVLIPFMFLVVQDFSWTVFSRSEWALAASILFAQGSAKLICGLAKYKVPNWPKGALFVALLISLSLLSVYIYSVVQNPSQTVNNYVCLQIILFLLSVFCFIVFGAVGQRLMDMPDEVLDEDHRNH